MSREPIFEPEAISSLRQTLIGAVAMLGQVAAGVLFLGGVGVAAHQCLNWLKTGVWSPLPISAFLTIIPTTGWIGLDKIIGIILDTPTSMTLILISIATLLATALIEEC